MLSDTAYTPAEMRREQLTELRDSGWREEPDGSFCKDGTRVTVGPAERDEATGRPAFTRTVAGDC